MNASEPVRLCEYDHRWPQLAAGEILRLSSLGRLEHIGSTAISGMVSRPEIDLLLIANERLTVSQLTALGYQSQREGEIYLYSKEPYSFHLRIIAPDNSLMNSLLFKEHLQTYPIIAERYSSLKREWARQSEEVYAAEKKAFLEKITERAILGRRFPIEVVPYDPIWPQLFEQESERLNTLFPSTLLLQLEHIGSTSVPGLAAKPVIDMIATITSFEEAEEKMVPLLEEQGYLYGSKPQKPGDHMMLWKGYHIPFPVRFHLHMATPDSSLDERIYFRDFLRRHEEAARQYEALKYELAQLYRNDREEYTEAKTDFIKEVTTKAMSEENKKRCY